MNYFSYQDNITGGVWSLFKDLGKITPAEREKMYANSEYAHTMEIISAALSGILPTDAESVDKFNLGMYEKRCGESDRVGRFETAKTVLNIVDFTTSSDSSLRVGFGDISERSLASKEDLFEEVLESTAFEENIRKLYNIRPKYISEKGVDVVSVLYGALKGIPEAVSKMKSLVSDMWLRELYSQLCEDSRDGALLRRLEAAV